MWYVYIIKSLKHRRIYIGLTNDLINRLKMHNDGKVLSTKFYLPWKLIYYEAYLIKDDAVKRERALKLHAKALGQLKKRIQASLES